MQNKPERNFKIGDQVFFINGVKNHLPIHRVIVIRLPDEYGSYLVANENTTAFSVAPAFLYTKEDAQQTIQGWLNAN